MFAEFGPFIVRDLLPWDAERIFELTGNSRTMRYMGFALHGCKEDAARLIEQYRNSVSRFFAVCPAGSPQNILGIVGLETLRHNATITIMFRSDWEARGAGRKFSVPFVQWIFTHPGIWRVWAYCHVDNVAVQRVLERMGAEREGRLRRFEVFPNISDEPQDCYVYSIVRNPR